VVGQQVFLPEFDTDRQEKVTMLSKTFNSGRIRRADYNPESQQLDLHWDNKSTLAYKHVPQEVYRRLCSAPNPTTYWEDRIAEEYPKGAPMTSSAVPTGTKTLNDLFGPGD
jgi:hypothetical protein